MMLKDLSDDSILVIAFCAMFTVFALIVGLDQCLKTVYNPIGKDRIERLETKLDDIHRAVCGAKQ